MRLRTLLCMGLLVFASAVNGQEEKKSMSLKEAVLGQYSLFAPDDIYGFDWIPDTKKYAFVKNYRQLWVAELKGEAKKVITVDQINESIGSEMRVLADVTWKDENTFYASFQNEFIVYHLNEKDGAVLNLPPNAENMTLHAESGQVAYTVKNDIFYKKFSSNPVRVTNNDDPDIVSGKAIARSEFGITGGLFWSNDGKKLAFYQKDESAVHDYPLLNINAYPGALKSVKYPMAGQPSEHAKIGIYNLKEKTTSFIEPRTGEESYLTNLTWTPDDERLLFAELNRGQNHMWLQVYDHHAQFIKTVFEETSDTWVEPERPPYFYTGSSDEFAWVSERDGFDNLYLYSIEDGLKEQLTNNEFVIKDVLKATEDGSLFYTATGPNPLNTQIYKLSKNGKQHLLTPEAGTHSAKIHCSGKYIFDQYSAHDIPGKSRILKRDRVVKELVNADNPLADYAISPAEISTVSAMDSTKLYTRMIKPYDFDSTKQYPVLVYVYGGPHAQMITNEWLDGASLWMHWMANQGYIVYSVDNRGSAYRGVDFEHCIHRNLGKYELEDQITGAKYLKQLPYVDADRIAVHGWSFGGFMTTTMLLKAKDHFNAGVAGGLVSDWKFYEVMYGERYMDRPEENEEGYASASLLNHAEKLEDDLLMIHGTADNVVVMQHSLTLVKKMIEHGIQVDYFPYPMHEHNVRGEDRVHLMEKVLNYIMEHNR
ncbi:MAG: DPP IV N-terminal domain-containing protein [Bacteroidota bacterium]